MTRLRSATHRSWILQLAVASLLLMQSIGLLHGVAHRPGSGGAVIAAAAGAALEPQAAGLFAGHDRESLECRLFNQLAHADLASVPTLALPCDFGAAPHATPAPCGHVSAFTCGYHARGPPALV
jgi:hypothetical protein